MIIFWFTEGGRGVGGGGGSGTGRERKGRGEGWKRQEGLEGE